MIWDVLEAMAYAVPATFVWFMFALLVHNKRGL